MVNPRRNYTVKKFDRETYEASRPNFREDFLSRSKRRAAV
jgi:hypothetical protein